VGVWGGKSRCGAAGQGREEFGRGGGRGLEGGMETGVGRVERKGGGQLLCLCSVNYHNHVKISKQLYNLS